METKTAFEIWKTITVGSGTRTAHDFREAILRNGRTISDDANELLRSIDFSKTGNETELKLVLVTVSELGFKVLDEEGVKACYKISEIYNRAQKLGLTLCPAEVGPQLCLQYADQPKGEHLTIGMHPVFCSDKLFRHFYVDHYQDGGYETGQVLHSSYGQPDISYYGDECFVFILTA